MNFKPVSSIICDFIIQKRVRQHQQQQKGDGEKSGLVFDLSSAAH